MYGRTQKNSTQSPRVLQPMLSQTLTIMPSTMFLQTHMNKSKINVFPLDTTLTFVCLALQAHARIDPHSSLDPSLSMWCRRHRSHKPPPTRHQCWSKPKGSGNAPETLGQGQGFIQQELRNFLFYHEVKPTAQDESLCSTLKGLIIFHKDELPEVLC